MLLSKWKHLDKIIRDLNFAREIKTIKCSSIIVDLEKDGEGSEYCHFSQIHISFYPTVPWCKNHMVWKGLNISKALGASNDGWKLIRIIPLPCQSDWFRYPKERQLICDTLLVDKIGSALYLSHCFSQWFAEGLLK